MTEVQGSLLAPFREELFVEHDGWRSLERILRDSGGGSYGLSGPRGIGKTWMMDRALEQTAERDGLGVWFPSPSEYEPTAFLAALSDVVATRFEEYYDERTQRPTETARWRYLRNVSLGLLLTYGAWVLLITREERLSLAFFDTRLTRSHAVFILTFFVGLAIVFRSFRRLREERGGLGRVRSQAEELRQQVRFTVSSTESEEGGVQGVLYGLSASLKRARERQLVERPATLSSFVHNFRAFVSSAAKQLDGPIVIAIDELDKMSDPARVAQLLRDIKGIFEIPGAYFLVSLSDEAARSLDLGSVRTRDEFNSSFYTVISLASLSPEQCVAVLMQRDGTFNPGTATAISILTGGVSRELVRVAEFVRLQCSGSDSVELAVKVAMREELLAFGARVLETADLHSELRELGDESRVELFAALQEVTTALENGEEGLRGAVRSRWDLNAGSALWAQHFSENGGGSSSDSASPR